MAQFRTDDLPDIKTNPGAYAEVLAQKLDHMFSHLSMENFAQNALSETPLASSILIADKNGLYNGKTVEQALQEAANNNALKADDDTVVHNTGDETVGGVKTFSNNITAPNVIYGETIYGGTILTNINTLVKNGFYSALSTATGVPNTSYNWLIIHNNSNLGTTSAYQKAVAVNSASTIIYERVKQNSSWGSWTQVVTRTELNAKQEGLYPSFVSPSSVNVASGTNTVLCSLSLPAGTYLLFGSCVFASNSSGARGLSISEASSFSAAGPSKVDASVNWGNGLQCWRYIGMSAQTMYLVAYQSSGSTLTVSSIYLLALKVA